jgi:hypothetical protein
MDKSLSLYQFAEKNKKARHQLFREQGLMVHKGRIIPCVQGFVYLLAGGGYHKIGQSVLPARRKTELNGILPFSLVQLHIIAVRDMDIAEQYLHQRYKEFHVKGEWFRLSDEAVSEFCSFNTEILESLVEV